MSIRKMKMIAVMAIMTLITACASAQTAPTATEAETAQAAPTATEAETAQAAPTATTASAASADDNTAEASVVLANLPDGRHTVTNGVYRVTWEGKYFLLTEVSEAGEKELFRQAMSEELIQILDSQMVENPEKFLTACIEKYSGE